MVKKLTRLGNSLAVVIDKPILEQMGLDADSPLELSTDGEVLIITRAGRRARTAKIRAALEDLDARYAGVFRKLAE